MKIRQLTVAALPALAAIILTGCGQDTGGDAQPEADAPDVTAEVQEHYRTKVSLPPETWEALEKGQITQEEVDAKAAAGEFPRFFQFATPADIPADLDWQDGSDLPEFASPDAKRGGTYYTWIQDFPRTLRRFGPDANGSFRPFILDDVITRLGRRHPNDTSITGTGFRYYPGIAREWALDKENATVYIRIDPDARFSDGEPITADDMMFMFFVYQSPHIQAPWYNNWYNRKYSNITKYDDLTFSIRQPEVRPDLLFKVMELEPLPEHFYRELGPDYPERYQWRFVPTSGAYEVRPENLKKGQSITLTRVKDWWADDKKFWRNRYNFDRIHFTVIRDVPKAFEAFRKGELDRFTASLPEYWYEKLPDDSDEVQNGYIHKEVFYNDIPRPTYGLWINQSKPLLDNRDIRIGIQHATNWDYVIQKYFRGDYQRMRTGSDGYGEFTHPTLKAREYSVDKALEHFAKAGFTTRGEDGILVNDAGKRLSFTVNTGYQTLRDVLTILAEEAAKAGLEFRLEVLDSTASWKKTQEKKHDIAFAAFAVSAEMYPRYWDFGHSVNAYDRAFLPDGSPNPDRKVKTQTNNLQVLAYPELDAMIEQYRASSDAGEMKELAYRMEELLYEDASFVPGFVIPFYRDLHWRWLRYPEDFNVKLSRGADQFFLSWIDTDMKKETREARKSGETFPPVIAVYDQYRTE
jgi:microcin C transport system substrate-binding protein